MAKPPLKKRLRKLLRSPKLLLISGVLIVLSTTLLFANKGLWRHVQLRHEIAVEEANLAKLEVEEKAVQKQVDLLKKEDPSTIERIARERYAMQRPGEEIYFEERK